MIKQDTIEEMISPYLPSFNGFRTEEFIDMLRSAAESVLAARSNYPDKKEWKNAFPLESRTTEGQMFRLSRITTELCSKRNAIIRAYGSQSGHPNAEQKQMIAKINGELDAEHKKFRAFCAEVGDDADQFLSIMYGEEL